MDEADLPGSTAALAGETLGDHGQQLAAGRTQGGSTILGGGRNSGAAGSVGSVKPAGPGQTNGKSRPKVAQVRQGAWRVVKDLAMQGRGAIRADPAGGYTGPGQARADFGQTEQGKKSDD